MLTPKEDDIGSEAVVHYGPKGRHKLRIYDTREAMREGNPQLALGRGEPVELPPTLIVQGTADDNVPLSVSQRFVEAYRAAGGTVELELFPDMPHGFARNPGAASDRALELMKAFVAHQLTGSQATA
jgi:acetyl esterase